MKPSTTKLQHGALGARSSAEMTRQANELELIRRVRRASQERDVDTVLHTVAQSTYELFGYHLVSVYLLEGELLRQRHQVGYDLVLTDIPLDKGIMARVARSGEAELVENVADDPDFLAAVEDATSEICIPLKDAGQVVGVLNIETSGEHRLDQEDFRLLTGIGEQLSLELERIRLYQQVSEQKYFYETVLSHSPIEIVVFDAEHRYRFINQAAIKNDAIRAWIIGKDDFEYCRYRGFDLDIARRRRAQFQETLMRRSATSWDASMTGPDGETRHYSRHFVPVYAEDGTLEMVVGYGLEITALKQAQTRLQHEITFSNSIINSLPGTFYLIDAQQTFVRWNRNLETIYGYSSDEIAHLTPLELIAKEHRERVADAIRRVFRGEQVQIEANTRTRAGALTPQLLTGHPVMLDGKRHLIGTGVDISERVHAETALKHSETNLRAILEHSRDAFMLVDKNYTILAFNKITEERVSRVFGRDIQVGDSALEFVRPADMETYQDAIARTFAGESVVIEREIETQNGESYWTEISYNPVWNDEGEVIGTAFSSRDVTERKRYEEQVVHMAYYDPLSHLPNRRLLHERAAHALAIAARQQRPVSLIYLDLDRFKQVNDTLGHEAGDALLVKVAKEFEDCLRQSDTLARLGGDEFALLLIDTGPEDSKHVAERVLEKLEHPFDIQDQQLHIGGSLGIACFPEHGKDLETLLKHADIAMYQAKHSGSGLAFFDPDTSPYSLERLTLETELRRAVAAKTLILHYQSIFDLHRDTTTGYEALVRWPRDGRLVPAGMFIELAEESELIRQIDLLVLEQAVQQASRWRESGQTLQLSLNLSARSLHYDNLLGYLERLLERSGLPPGRLMIEVTESAAMRQPEASQLTLEALKALGLKLAIDDFGSGYASLTYLRKLPADRVKIDKKLIQGIGVDRKDEEIVKAAIALGHGLEMEVVAEGIETDAQLAWLRAHDCDLVQGYLLGEPKPAHTFTK